MKQIPFIFDSSQTQIPVLYWVETCGSTQDIVQQLVSKSEFQQNGVACFTFNQTQGRGQGNNNWTDSENLSIAYSIAIPLPETTDLVLLNKHLTLQIRSTIQFYLNVPVLIKWPNDMICLNRKISGLLMQVHSNEFGNKFLILGVGINVNHLDFDQDLSKAISMRMVENQVFDLEEMVKKLHLKLSQATNQLKISLNKNSSEINSQFNLNLWKMGEFLECLIFNNPQDIEGRRVQALIKGVDSAGRILVEYQSMENKSREHQLIEQAFHHGQIKLLI